MLVDDKNYPSLTRIITDSRDMSFLTADESRIEIIWETNGFGSMSDKTPSRQINITCIRKPRYPDMATLHIVNTVLTLRVSLKCEIASSVTKQD